MKGWSGPFAPRKKATYMQEQDVSETKKLTNVIELSPRERKKKASFQSVRDNTGTIDPERSAIQQPRNVAWKIAFNAKTRWHRLPLLRY